MGTRRLTQIGIQHGRRSQATANGYGEDRIQSLLDQFDSDLLFVSACVSNQGKFYSRLDQIVLLSAPRSTMVDRPENRTNNPYGKRPEDVAEALHYKETIEPLLRRGATTEIVTSMPLSDVVDQILDLARRP